MKTCGGKSLQYSSMNFEDFPPKVFINSDGTTELVKNEFYYWKSKEKNQRDILLLTGDYQGLSSQGQYELVEKILDIAEENNVNEMYTLGGYGLGHEIKNPKVLCATKDKKLVAIMKKYGAVFKKNEPGGGIVGASGLLLGLGKLRDMQGICQMGETPGYLVEKKCKS